MPTVGSLFAAIIATEIGRLLLLSPPEEGMVETPRSTTACQV